MTIQELGNITELEGYRGSFFLKDILVSCDEDGETNLPGCQEILDDVLFYYADLIQDEFSISHKLAERSTR